MERRTTDPQIDEAYGLEPVFEPADTESAGTGGGAEYHLVDCPYCGEPFETLIDLSAGSQAYVEDCQVCCQPIEFRVAVDHAGALEALQTLRSDA